MNARKKIFLPLLVAVLALAAFAFAACNNGQQDETDPAEVVSSVALDKTSAFLEVGEENASVTLTASLTVSEEGADVEVTWTSSNASVASVSGSTSTAGEGDDAVTVYTGTVTAAANGFTVITASAGNKSATCVVAVADAIVSDTQQLTEAAASVQEGGVIALQAGTYEAELSVAARSVSLVGAGEESVTLNGSVAFSGGSCFVSGMTVSAAEEASAVSVAGDDAQLTLRRVTIGGGRYGADLGAPAEGRSTSLSVYDCTFRGVWCAMRADTLASLLRVSFQDVTYQFCDAAGYYTAIGGSAVTPSA